MSELIDLLHLRELARGSLIAVATMVLLGIPIAYFEHRRGADMKRYFNRAFAHDFAYTLLYRSGAFALLGASYTAELVYTHFSIIRFDALAGLPLTAKAFAFWLLADFFNYWVHRAQHAVPLFWHFHVTHHANERLTFISTHRLHPLEQIFHNAAMVVALLVLGVPTPLWFPFALVLTFFELVQHAELDWKYGPFYRILVSPVFHRIHHSPDRVDHDHNYAKVLSLWDFLFGTAAQTREAPRVYGVRGLPSEPTLVGQFAAPFRHAFGRGGEEDVAVLQQKP